MNQIEFNILSDNLLYEGDIILQYKIKYPKIVKSRYSNGQRKFNLYYHKKILDLENYIKNNLYREAKELYIYNKENNYPIMVYEIDLIYYITKNENEIVSLYSDEYIYSGGAHGNTIRESQTWNLQKANLMELQDFCVNNPYYVIDILKEINSQIRDRIKKYGEGVYFDNYCELVLDNFKFQNFYLYKNFIAIFFQQYDIAPYSTGIPVFYIDNICKK